MFRSEWKKLKSPMMVIVILAIILVPFLYNSIFLSAFWDPYGQTEDIKVAIVNEDKTIKYEGEKIDIGDQFIKKLKKNDDFDWQFLSSKEAEKQLRSGEIYMTVVIPKNFSKNATTLLDEHPKKIELEYYLNPAKNYSGTQISSNAAKQLNEKIRKSVTKQYSSAIFGALKKIAQGLEDASEGSSKLEDGANKTTDGAKTLTTNLGKLTDGTNDLSTNLAKAADGSSQLSTGLNTLNDGAQTLAEKSGELSSGLNQLDDNSGKLIKGSTDLQAGSTKLRQGLESASAGSTQLRQGIESASAGASELDSNLPKFNAGLNQLNEKAQEVDATITNLNSAAATLKQDLSDRREAIEANVATIKGVISSSENLSEEEKSTLLESIATMEQNVQSLAQQETALDASLAAANNATDKINQLAVGGQSIASAVSQLDDGLVKLLSGAKDLEQGQNKLLSGAKDLEQGQTDFNQGLTTYTDGVHKAADGSTQLTAGAQKIATGTNDASTAMGSLNSGLGQLTDGAVALSSGAGQLTDGASRLADGNSKLADGAKTLKDELGKGAKDATVKPSNDRDNMLAEPVVLKEHDYSTVSNYGSGLSAYILSIALFAGALMFSSVYQIRPAHGETLSWRFLVGKLSLILPIGALQGVAAATAIVYVLDSTVASVPALYGFAALTGMTFITLLFALTMLFGRVGQFAAFLLLLLQIGGSGGTFPVEMTPSFFQYIHPFLPMTYSVSGFREALGLGVTDALASNSLVLGSILAGALVLVFVGALSAKRILLSTKARKAHDAA
ncbi:YhgE/Pip domain-containing protein [Exiguobacterium oxidotolerans]|uniref:YhgE/Pip domain-containing protein n=1 Tax=Exiguobacterium oxidotolerans TaxID=223958 RepID=UPI000494037B|nr:YhgE/Pip domain-containing protein [Exiguobacterium oxidotolerans]